VAGFERSNQVVGRFFGSVLDFFCLHGLFLFCRFRSVCPSLRAAAGQREERSPEEGTGRERKARFVSNGFGVGLAPNRRGPKPPEPRVSGVYPEEGAVGRREKSEKQY
jgi:hypothetical protein